MQLVKSVSFPYTYRLPLLNMQCIVKKRNTKSNIERRTHRETWWKDNVRSACTDKWDTHTLPWGSKAPLAKNLSHILHTGCLLVAKWNMKNERALIMGLYCLHSVIQETLPLYLNNCILILVRRLVEKVNQCSRIKISRMLWQLIFWCHFQKLK